MEKVVVLDPGHCLDTVGKASPDGTYSEYEFNWDMVLKIEANLKRSGIKVVKTRNYVDKDSSLSDRVKIANKSGADLFYSCHSNALKSYWTSHKGCGFYIYKVGGKAEKLYKMISSSVFPNLTKEFELKNRGLYTEDFYVLRKTTMPAILVENAFHTNEDDVKLLRSQFFRRKMAEYTSKGICKYLDVKYVEDKNNYEKYKVIKTGNVVSTDNLNIRIGPSMKNKVIGILNPKCYVEILDEINGWYKIFYGEGFGYVYKKYVNLNG